MLKRIHFNGKTTNIGICTQKDTKASIKMFKAKNFKFIQGCLVCFKSYESIKGLDIKIDDFNIESWNISYEDFKNLDYFKNFNNKLASGFTYLNICEDVYNDLVKNTIATNASIAIKMQINIFLYLDDILFDFLISFLKYFCISKPQFGQLFAVSDTSLPHSGQVTNAIINPPCHWLI